jgi:hypothetical protein
MTLTAQETPLTADDRCDRCGARAYYRACLANGELMFCAHHGRAALDRLTQVALTVEDHTHQLADEI